MRLKSVIAPDAAKAMATIRATLGEDAIIVATQELKDGSVRVTAAIESADLDLAELLAAPEAKPQASWFASLAAHHEIPDPLRRHLHEHVAAIGGTAPAPALAQALHHIFRFEPLGEASSSPVLLLGPPGAGKTASVAKLAARAVLAGRTVEVISNDAARAGGLEQLSALLQPLRLAPQAAPDPATLRRLVRARRAGLLLIDSPGLNPFRPADIGRISALIEASEAEPVLVLPAGMCAADCADIGHTYAALGAKRLLVTKLDVTRRLGGLLAAASAGLLRGRDRAHDRPGPLPLERSWPCPPASPCAEHEFHHGEGERQGGRAEPGASVMNRIIAIASGKGGVGKTWLAITLGHALARLGQRVLLFDGDLGLANVDIQLGLDPERDLGSVLSGRCELPAAVQRFEAGGFDLVAGRSGSGQLAAIGPERLAGLLGEVATVAAGYDQVLLDLPAGIDALVRRLLLAADMRLVVTSDEPTALTDAYALIKVSQQDRAAGEVRIAVNMAPSHEAGRATYQGLARVCERFLQLRPALAGVVRRDPRVPDAIRHQTPLLARHLTSPAGRDVEAMARRLVGSP